MKKLFHPHIARRALRVALIVGTVLTVINHYDLLFGEHLNAKVLIQIILTYMVPYLVSAHGQLLAYNSPDNDKDGSNGLL